MDLTQNQINNILSHLNVKDAKEEEQIEALRNFLIGEAYEPEDSDGLNDLLELAQLFVEEDVLNGTTDEAKEEEEEELEELEELEEEEEPEAEPAAKKSPAKKTPVKKQPAAKKAPAKKTPAKKATKPAAKKSSPKKPAPKKESEKKKTAPKRSRSLLVKGNQAIMDKLDGFIRTAVGKTTDIDINWLKNGATVKLNMSTTSKPLFSLDHMTVDVKGEPQGKLYFNSLRKVDAAIEETYPDPDLKHGFYSGTTLHFIGLIKAADLNKLLKRKITLGEGNSEVTSTVIAAMKATVTKAGTKAAKKRQEMDNKVKGENSKPASKTTAKKSPVKKTTVKKTTKGKSTKK